MATGRLGTADLSATTPATIFTATAGKVTSFSVSVCNRNTTAVTFRLSLCDTSTAGADEYVEYDTALSGNSAFERTGLVLDAGKLLVAYASAANVSVVAYGYEE